MQGESSNDENQGDNVSCHSDDSTVSATNSNSKEKLDFLINMELKHSGVYYDLHSKNILLKVDLENVYNSCQRLENQARKRSELLEESYEKLTDYQKKSRSQLQEKLNSTLKEIDTNNYLFCTAFKNYDPEFLKNSVHQLDNDAEKLAKDVEKNTDFLQNLCRKGEIAESLITSKPSEVSNIEIVNNMLSEMSMKRPEIKLEETVTKLSNELKNLALKQQHMKSAYEKK
ncbi:uncharacterized protein LOC100680300 [Nasonia vitripennis]|uniref:Uncharacterized protein n=1 Tax=Nasonia vitripennis TaxID=7425 RepID=A0A7M7ILX8_NASVI|nr:uncharacterized protein LOC100680300 [Nasonia vitripennis]XP_031779329.1 uncharacterized protein LOC100680300 [Nasonia vitripennis]